jgi:hypothetical protein
MNKPRNVLHNLGTRERHASAKRTFCRRKRGFAIRLAVLNDTHREQRIFVDWAGWA